MHLLQSWLLQDGVTVTALLTDLNKINVGQTLDFTWSKTDAGDVVNQLKTETITNSSLSETVESTYTIANADIGSITVSVAYTDRGNEYSVGQNNWLHLQQLVLLKKRISQSYINSSSTGYNT